MSNERRGILGTRACADEVTDATRASAHGSSQSPAAQRQPSIARRSSLVPRRSLLIARRSVALSALLTLAVLPCSAQQTPARADSLATRPDYPNLAALLAALPNSAPPGFDETRALWVGSLPLGCMDRLQPRTPTRGGGAGRGGNTPADSAARGGRAGADSSGRAGAAGTPAAVGRGGADYFWVATYRLIDDHKRTRAFWGCTDWHSAASSTWVTARLLKKYPGLGLQELGREKLSAHLGKSNLEGELNFFRSAAGQFERPYGYAWLLKLQSELRTWPDSQATRWAGNVTPLANWMADSLRAHLAALQRPVRTGTINNTALTILLALDYADALNNTALRSALNSAARRFFAEDRACNTLAEASANGRAGGAGRAAASGAAGDSAAGRGNPPRAGGGGANQISTDILSPCLTVAALMARALDRAAYLKWLNDFLPPLQSGRFAPLTQAPGAEASAGERARRAALAFQRAYAMERIMRALPASDARIAVWQRLSALQAERGFQLLEGDTSGSHWVPAFALLYIDARN